MTKRRKGSGMGQAIGGILVGFDQQILRNLPPVEELVTKGQPVRAVSGDDPIDLVIVLPDDSPSDETGTRSRRSTDPTGR